MSQAPAGFLPRVYYGLTSGNSTYRFAAGASLEQEVTGSIGTAFQLYSENETDNNYIPAVAVKETETTIKIVIRGDYNVNTSSFKAVNMTTGASATVTFTNPLTLQPASSLSDYPAEDNKEKQITVIYDLETNSKNVIFASLDYNSDGVYNWVEIGNFVDGIDGLSVRSINSSNYSSVKALCKANDTLLAGEEFTEDGTSFVIGGLYNVDTLSPFSLTLVGNIRGATGATGATGAAGADGADGATPYIQNDYWYINGTNTNVKALGTDGTNGADGTSFQMQSGLYSVPANWGQTGNIDPDGNALLQLPTLPTTGITGKGYVVYDPLTTPLAPYYDLYYANDGDTAWTIIHPFNGVAGQDGTDGHTPYIQDNNWYINGVNTGVPATGPQGPAGASATLYLHNISLQVTISDQAYKMTANIINSTSTAYTSTGDIASWLYNNGYQSANNTFVVSGSSTTLAVGIYSENGTGMKTKYLTTTTNTKTVTIDGVANYLIWAVGLSTNTYNSTPTFISDTVAQL